MRAPPNSISPPSKKGANGIPPLAPIFFSTLFSNIPYQKIGNAGEQCRIFLSELNRTAGKHSKNVKFGNLTKKFVTLCYRPRAPPRLRFASNQISNDRRSAWWQKKRRNSKFTVLYKNIVQVIWHTKKGQGAEFPPLFSVPESLQIKSQSQTRKNSNKEWR